MSHSEGQREMRERAAEACYSTPVFCEDPIEQAGRDKAAVGYGDREAVEIFPPDYAVVNVANMRHLWVLAGRMAFSWGPRWKPAYCPRCARVQETIADGTTCKVCHLVLP